jgi:hypothetical protein
LELGFGPYDSSIRQHSHRDGRESVIRLLGCKRASRDFGLKFSGSVERSGKITLLGQLLVCVASDIDAYDVLVTSRSAQQKGKQAQYFGRHHQFDVVLSYGEK